MFPRSPFGSTRSMSSRPRVVSLPLTVMTSVMPRPSSAASLAASLVDLNSWPVRLPHFVSRYSPSCASWPGWYISRPEVGLNRLREGNILCASLTASWVRGT